MKTSNWLKKNAADLSGKVVAISGATGGLGNALCRHLASLGASLIMLDRNRERSLAFAEKLKHEFPNLKTRYIHLDLEDISSVKSAAAELENDIPHFLILNAGAYHIPKKICSTGYNDVFQINFSSPFYLAQKLKDKISEKDGKIVAVGSIAHGYCKADPGDIDFSRRTKSSLIYGNAKRYLMYSLASLNSSAIAIAHPGITFTNITAHYPKLVFAIIKHPMKFIFMRPERASLSIIYAMLNNINESCWVGPAIFNIWGLPRVSKLKIIRKEEREIILAAAANNNTIIERI